MAPGTSKGGKHIFRGEHLEGKNTGLKRLKFTLY
jgi:hypothetical protein